ncbi:hypothetical protein C1X69_07955 [Pseudomonas sp. FW305-67]|nr:hypothetical protein C1X70_05455 [Pseudomonas sp. FW305-53]PMY88139.1 hypothetical protein C1X68_04935 [Pseudomonas sp. FW303-C2]PMY89863.1 hypothetical protein C1X67_26725 [Pseudomonas sp. FW305-62]PNA44850.1 hypothetical protein C1X71_06650 [Pseudomonas sp. FW306-2-2C-A10BC]PNA87505.1 hypothetical protein C1X66_08045 [Pseudomonas sp. MPR-R3B]PNB22173.1 hypothetical protein C1X69_07955 [Pseudomonas sp. FW305-67]
MDGPAYYWMSARGPESRHGAGYRASMEPAIAIENAPSRAKIVLFKGNGPIILPTLEAVLAPTGM